MYNYKNHFDIFFPIYVINNDKGLFSQEASSKHNLHSIKNNSHLPRPHLGQVFYSAKTCSIYFKSNREDSISH